MKIVRDRPLEAQVNVVAAEKSIGSKKYVSVHDIAAEGLLRANPEHVEI